MHFGSEYVIFEQEKRFWITCSFVCSDPPEVKRRVPKKKRKEKRSWNTEVVESSVRRRALAEAAATADENLARKVAQA